MTFPNPESDVFCILLHFPKKRFTDYASCLHPYFAERMNSGSNRAKDLKNEVDLTFESGDGHVGNQSIELVWRVFIFITFSGQPHTDPVWDIPDSFGPDGFVEPGVDAHIRGSHLLHGKLPDFFECPRGTLLETHSMDALVNVDGVFSCHHLVDGGPALLLLAALLCGSHLNPGDKAAQQ